jgi:nitrogenase molybdenum-iron protein alpha/beta subunit
LNNPPIHREIAKSQKVVFGAEKTTKKTALIGDDPKAVCCKVQEGLEDVDIFCVECPGITSQYTINVIGTTIFRQIPL